MPVLGALPAPLAVYSYLVGGVSYSNVQYKLNLRGCLVDWGEAMHMRSTGRGSDRFTTGGCQ